MTGEQFVQWVLILVAVEGITELLVQSVFFQPLRTVIFNRAHPHKTSGEPYAGSPPWRFLNKLFSCGYCMSVWASMVGAIFTPVHLPLAINWLVSVLVLHRLSNFLHDAVTAVEKIKMVNRMRTQGSYVQQYDVTHQVEIHGSSGQIGGPQRPPVGPQSGPETG